MKFTVAAGILTQLLPAISEKNPSDLLEQDRGSNEHDHDFVFLNKKRALKSPFHRGNARRGQGETHVYQSRQLLDGLLKTVPFANMKACDPSSGDPDIGILSCDPGYECVSDQDSTLGGICTSVSRDLQIPLYACDLCGDGAIMGSANFDLPVYSSAGIQGVTCGSLQYTAYQYGMSQTICYYGARGQARSAGCCVSYDCSVCGEGQELLADVITSYTKIDAAGAPYLTCGSIQPVLDDTQCATLTPILAPTCCAGAVAPAPAPVASPSVPVTTPSVPVTTPTVPVTTPTVPAATCSSICGDGEVMGYENFMVEIDPGVYCGMLSVFAYSGVLMDGAPNFGSCGDAVLWAAGAGCCAPSFDCNPCGEGELLADAVYFEDDTLTIDCGLFVRSLNQTACTLYTTDIAPTCCAGPTVPVTTPTVPVTTPTVPVTTPTVPVTSPTVPADTAPAPAPPTSASDDRWSTSSLVSMSSLTVVTVGSLLLN